MIQTHDNRLGRPWLDEAYARFEADNGGLVSETAALLGRVISDAALHGRFTNTLALLEHTGSFKIMATQHSASVDRATLQHIAEECHHAFFMKRQAEKTAGRPLEFVDGDLLAPASARMYFQRLEAAMLGVLERGRSARAAYLYMSLIVEFRALWFYRLYEQVLKRAGHVMSLKRVLGEEQRHLGEMAQRLETDGELSDERVARFLAAERKLYGRLLAAMRRAIGPKNGRCS
jgi:hypothetical protein